MASKDLIRIFISHAWHFGGDYGRVVQLLYNLPFLHWENYSNPKDSGGFFTTNSSKKKKLTDQIHPVHLVIIVADMYETDREWIAFELKEAVRMKKPIILVEPKIEGARTPQALLNVAQVVVPWHEYKLGSAVQGFAIR